MSDVRAAVSDPVRVGLVGAGRIGTSHATLLARHVPGAELVAVADPRPGAAHDLAVQLGCRPLADPAALFADPQVEAVIITASSTAHVDLVLAATAAGKAVFCEKPLGLTLEGIDRCVAAAEAAGVALQVGFNRRFSVDFAAAHRLVVDGAVGTPQLMRSLTRDPSLADPGGVPPWTIFLQTLIHDFDALLWLNPGAEPVTVYATADALVAPEYKDDGLLDTAVVVVTFDNGAIAVARSSLVHSDRAGRHVDTVRGDVELFRDAYTAEFVEFTDAVRQGRTPAVTGQDARRALLLALASIESVKTRTPVPVDKVDAR
jgi:myo-inositol 2-dehydrogenase/D-chiro-inositol 1-dehydrogenase